MAVSQTAHAALVRRISWLVVTLLAAFGIITTDLQRDSLWFDEAYSLYVVRDEVHAPEGILGTARFIVDSLRQAVERARADVHPPLYFLLFDSWTLLSGDSAYAARFPSALFGLMAAAATYALGRRLFDRRSGWMALVVLATAGLFIYYSREARMYTLLMALAALATLAYVRWRQSPSLIRAIVYGLVLAALPYTHYAGACIGLTHGLHLLLTRPRQLGRWSLPVGWALLLFAPWIPSLVGQFQTHGGPAAAPFTDLGTALAALLFFLTGGYWALYLVPFLLGSRLTRIRRQSDTLTLLLLWLLVTPVLLLIVNTWIPGAFQVRYTLGVLPATALLVAYGIGGAGELRWPVTLPGPVKTALPGVLLAAIVFTQLTVYPAVWPSKPRWADAVRQMTAVRQPLEPAITLIPAHSPAAYYDRIDGIRRGIALDLAWRWQEPADIQSAVAHMGTADSVWLVMPSTFASTWDAARDLLDGRQVGYRDSVMDMLFYRFDRLGGDSLAFQFSDQVGYLGGIQNILYAQPGEDFCFRLQLTALQALAPGSAADFSLTQGYDTVRARAAFDLGAHDAGETLDLAPCIPIPPENPAGPHHLRLRILSPASGPALPLLEHGSLYWSDTLIFALVSVG